MATELLLVPDAAAVDVPLVVVPLLVAASLRGHDDVLAVTRTEHLGPAYGPQFVDLNRLDPGAKAAGSVGRRRGDLASDEHLVHFTASRVPAV